MSEEKTYNQGIQDAINLILSERAKTSNFAVIQKLQAVVRELENKREP